MVDQTIPHNPDKEYLFKNEDGSTSVKKRASYLMELMRAKFPIEKGFSITHDTKHLTDPITGRREVYVRAMIKQKATNQDGSFAGMVEVYSDESQIQIWYQKDLETTITNAYARLAYRAGIESTDVYPAEHADHWTPENNRSYVTGENALTDEQQEMLSGIIASAKEHGSWESGRELIETRFQGPGKAIALQRYDQARNAA